jgi:septum formation protein
MLEVTSELLEWYLATGESMGKAGAYAVQGQGAALTADVRGELDTVIGLPVRLLGTLLGRIGLDLREISGSGK